MSDQPQDQNQAGGPKKISLAEAIKQKLAQKKAEQAEQRANPKSAAGNGLAVKSQMTKKVNNQRRRTGGS
ncbi:hypothetical protein [Paenibacillus sp. GP183]|jgi:hypothetical protein|uniref:hypothetical protein n=1 Tax=Paenibacillus sp. GP183 TaxID=1882751 RepID=UPI00089A71B2|nr:hypothetical protein [Paenibacillus sp. GP183]SEB56967.1 hypothetical protein SAMN05443246_1121 [Paenibacillus sp. GP183]